MAAAAMVGLAAYAALARDRTLARGWIGLIPTTILVCAVPVNADSWDWRTDEQFDGTTSTTLNGVGSRGHRLLDEVVTRFDDRDVWLLHWRVFLARVFDALPELRAELCQSRETWPEGAPVHVRGCIPSIFIVRHDDLWIDPSRNGPPARPRSRPTLGQPWCYDEQIGIADGSFDVHIEIGVATRQVWQEHHGVLYPVGPDPTSYRTVWRGIARTITTARQPADPLMTPIDDPSDGSEIAKDLRPTLLVRRDGSVALGVGHADYHVGGPSDCAVGLRLEVLRDGECVATGERFIFNHPAADGIGSINRDNLMMTCPLRWTGRAPTLAEDLASAAWTLRAVGDPTVSLRDFNRSRYWAGTIELPIVRLTEAEADE